MYIAFLPKADIADWYCRFIFKYGVLATTGQEKGHFVCNYFFQVIRLSQKGKAIIIKLYMDKPESHCFCLKVD